MSASASASAASTTTTISYLLNQQISHAVSHLPAGTYSLPDDAGKLAQELLIALGLIDRSSGSASASAPASFLLLPPPTPAPTTTHDASASAPTTTHDASAPAPAPARTRTVSKKMKDAFLASASASPDKSEGDLKRVIKSYKDASDADIAAHGGDFASFAAHILAAAPAPATPPPADKTKAATKAPAKPKKAEKTKPRVAWSAAEKKVFKDVVESAGSTVSDDLKAEFEAFVAAKSDDDFKAFAMAGHMRAWIDARIVPKAGAGHQTPAEYDLARSMQTLAVNDADEDADEDLEEIDVDGEQLLIGTASGDIFRPTEEAGDVKIGTAGVGKFKDVCRPSAA